MHSKFRLRKASFTHKFQGLVNWMSIYRYYKSLTRKAIFLSLFIAENCFRRESTAESRGLSGAIRSSTIQGWPETKDNSSLIRCDMISHTRNSSSLIFYNWLTSRLTKDLMCSQPFLGVSLKHFSYEILGTFWNTRPWFRFKIKFCLQYLSEDAHFSFWRMQKQQWQ